MISNDFSVPSTRSGAADNSALGVENDREEDTITTRDVSTSPGPWGEEGLHWIRGCVFVRFESVGSCYASIRAHSNDLCSPHDTAAAVNAAFIRWHARRGRCHHLEDLPVTRGEILPIRRMESGPRRDGNSPVFWCLMKGCIMPMRCTMRSWDHSGITPEWRAFPAGSANGGGVLRRGNWRGQPWPSPRWLVRLLQMAFSGGAATGGEGKHSPRRGRPQVQAGPRCTHCPPLPP